MGDLVDRLRAGAFRTSPFRASPFRELARAAAWHRRLLAAGLAAAAVALGLTALEPDPPPSSRVLTAARDLPSGTRLNVDDLRPAAFPEDLVPAGAAQLSESSELVGRVLAAPVRRGEPFTDRRVLGRGLLEAYGDGLVAVPVRVGDPGVLEFVRVGGRVDVLAAESTTDSPYGSTKTLASDVPVVALPQSADGSDTSTLSGFSATAPSGGGVVVLAVPPATAAELTRAAVTSHVSLAVRE